MAIHMGYMGSCTIAGTKLACTSLSVTKKTDPLFFDHIYGLRDSGGAAGDAVKTNGGTGGFDSRQKGIYRSSRSTSTASASGPLMEGNFSALMNAAIKGETVDAKFGFYKDTGKSLSNAVITSLSIDVKAGEVASFSVELMGTDVAVAAPDPNTECKKLITWDQCNITSTVSGDIMGYNLSISNPVIPIYVSGADDSLDPKELRIGMQEAKGSISSYAPNEWPGGGLSNIRFEVNGVTFTLSAVFSGPTNSPSTGPFVCTIPFTGASDNAAWTA